MPRRSLQRLERAAAEAATVGAATLAYYRLGLFHDDNGREAEAILNYEVALALGLGPPLQARCLAWLASSLLKTGRPAEAQARASEAEAALPDPELRRFLDRLEKRIARRLS